jgi:hypothetical protein
MAGGGARATARADASHRRAHALTADDPLSKSELEAFLKKLQELDWIEGCKRVACPE